MSVHPVLPTSSGWFSRLVRNVVAPLAEVATLVWASQRLDEPGAVGAAVVALVLLVVFGLTLLLRHDRRRQNAARHDPRVSVWSTWWQLPRVRWFTWDGEAGLAYLVRDKLRRDGAAHRDLAHERGAVVRIPMRWADPAYERVTVVPEMLPGRLDVVAHRGVLSPGEVQPEVLGDFVSFWTTCLVAASAGRLEVLRDGPDVCLSTAVVSPPNGQVLVLMTESDWDLVRACTPSAVAPTSAR